MNNRIAKKILCMKSSLSHNRDKVLRAKAQVALNPAYFSRKNLYTMVDISEWVHIVRQHPTRTLSTARVWGVPPTSILAEALRKNMIFGI